MPAGLREERRGNGRTPSRTTRSGRGVGVGVVPCPSASARHLRRTSRRSIRAPRGNDTGRSGKDACDGRPRAKKCRPHGDSDGNAWGSWRERALPGTRPHLSSCRYPIGPSTMRMVDNGRGCRLERNPARNVDKTAQADGKVFSAQRRQVPGGTPTSRANTRERCPASEKPQAAAMSPSGRSLSRSSRWARSTRRPISQR